MNFTPFSELAPIPIYSKLSKLLGTLSNLHIMKELESEDKVEGLMSQTTTMPETRSRTRAQA